MTGPFPGTTGASAGQAHPPKSASTQRLRRRMRIAQRFARHRARQRRARLRRLQLCQARLRRRRLRRARDRYRRAAAGLNLAMLAGACSTTPPPPDSISATIGSPCGVVGGIETAGTGLGIGALGGALNGIVYSSGCGPYLYFVCVAASSAVGATYGLGRGIYEAIAYTPACGDDVETASPAIDSVAPDSAPADMPKNPDGVAAHGADAMPPRDVPACFSRIGAAACRI